MGSAPRKLKNTVRRLENRIFRPEGALRSHAACIHLLKHCADKGCAFEMSGCLWNFGSLSGVLGVPLTCGGLRYTPCHELSGCATSQDRVLAGASEVSTLEIS